MTAATAPARRPREPGVFRGRPGPARLLRIELRRSPMLWMLPLLAALFWLSAYRTAMNNPPFWNIRAATLQANAMLVFAPLLAGVCAWAGSRDGRRGLVDLVGVTAVPRWAAQSATWAAATIWAEALYLAGVAVLYGVTAHQGAWGGPLWWPVAVGVAMIAACCALGFAAGLLLASRFTAPLAALVVFLALAGGAFAIQDNVSVRADLAAERAGPVPDRLLRDLLPVPARPGHRPGDVPGRARGRGAGRDRPAGRRGRPLAARRRGGGHRGRARGGREPRSRWPAPPGWRRTGSSSPHCTTRPATGRSRIPRCAASGAIPVCLQPAYRAYLPEVTAALGPVLGQLAGLPGAPVRVTQVAVTSVQSEQDNGIGFGGPVISGRPPVLYLPLSGLTLPGEGNASAAEFTSTLRQQYGPSIVNDLVGFSPGGGAGTGVSAITAVPGPGHAAQVAVAKALDQVMNLIQPGAQNPPGSRATPAGGGSPTRSGTGGTAGSGAPPLERQEAAAAHRFSALPAAVRHAWLLDSPDRAAGRPDHPQRDPVTAAKVGRPAGRRRPGAARPGRAWRACAWRACTRPAAAC